MVLTRGKGVGSMETMQKRTSLNRFGMAIGLLCATVTAMAQTEPVGTPSAQQAPAPQVSTQQVQVGRSLGEELNGLNAREVHIFFIHGIGSEGPHSHDSELLRKSICAYVKNCVKPEGEQVGGYDYVDGAKFGMNEAPPTMRYMGRPVWNSPEEWHAAASFVVHYKLARTTG